MEATDRQGAGHGLVATVIYTGGGGVRGKKIVPNCVPKIELSGPFDIFHFFPAENFSDVGEGSGGGAQAAIPHRKAPVAPPMRTLLC